MIDLWLIAPTLIAGAGFTLVSAIGVVRFPDLLTRLSATTKASTVGTGLMLVAVSAHFNNAGVSIRLGLVLLFGLLTVPVSAHAIARAGFFMRVPLWNRTSFDEIGGRYDMRTHTLEGKERAAGEETV